MPLHPRRNPDAARTIVGRVCDLTDTPAFATKSKADETVRAYRHDFAAFEVFCAANGHPSMPATPAAVAEFLASEQARGCKASTLTRRVASIRYRHKLNGHQSPTDDETARAVLSGIKRVIGSEQTPKTAATAEVIGEMLKCCPNTLTGKRDRALIARPERSRGLRLISANRFPSFE